MGIPLIPCLFRRIFLVPFLITMDNPCSFIFISNRFIKRLNI